MSWRDELNPGCDLRPGAVPRRWSGARLCAAPRGRPLDLRPHLDAAALLVRIAGNGVRTIVVETANRFARDLMVQEVGFAMLRDLGVTLIAADSPSSFLDDGPTSKLIRQILGAVSEFDKAMIVAKLKGAHDRGKT